MNTLENTPIKKAAEILGGFSELAIACGVTQQATYKWLWKQVPASRCLQIETLTKGKISRYELRPDVFGTPKKRKSA